MTTRPRRRTGPQLIRAFYRGDSDAMGELLQRYGWTLWLCARRILNAQVAAAADVAWDVVQQTMLRVAGTAGRPTAWRSGGAPFRVWLIRICKREALTELARACHWREVPQSVLDPDGKTDPLELAASAADSAAPALDRDLVAVILACVDELPEKSRTLVLGRYRDGLRLVDLAAKSEVDVSTIHRRLDRAIDTVRGRLAAQGVDVGRRPTPRTRKR
ncbi:MAG: sigma-70 family RNA polymerase sigma factor [Armatimonadetes bacterium]|nr:sigma-70 family RNA polymerase sigma factor [Armatimonadota bacterium]